MNNSIPDAILFGPGLAGGAAHRQRVHEACAKLEPLLGVGPESPDPAGKCWIRDMGRAVFFASRDHADTRYFKGSHDLYGQDRYIWTDGPDGLRFGALRPEASVAEAP